MTEWLKVHVLKTCVGITPTVGSNPTPSAISPQEIEVILTNEENWGGARVVDRGRLLSGCWVLSSTASSNLALSAKLANSST